MSAISMNRFSARESGRRQFSVQNLPKSIKKEIKTCASELAGGA